MGDSAVGTGWDGVTYPLILKFHLPAGTIEYSAFLPEGWDPEDTYRFSIYDRIYWQPVEADARHKSGHEFFTLTFEKRLTSAVEVVIVKA